jgi:hypothetical protein
MAEVMIQESEFVRLAEAIPADKYTLRPSADVRTTFLHASAAERGVLLFIVRHIAKHLGQQIGYARFIGVVPPWATDSPRKN